MRNRYDPDCDGALGQPCDMRNGVRVLPYPGGNLNLCRAHFMREMRFRQFRNAGLHGRAQYELPSWESLRAFRELEREPLPEYESR